MTAAQQVVIPGETTIGSWMNERLNARAGAETRGEREGGILSLLFPLSSPLLILKRS